MSDRDGAAGASPIPDEAERYDGNKPAAAIEDDIARTRAELSETLDALERKLAPRHLLEKGVDMLRDSMDGNFGRVGETLRGNPIPLAMIGVGFGWLLLSGSGGTRRVGDAARAAGRTVGRRISEAADRASGVASDVAARAGDLASDAANRAKEMVGGGAAYPTEGDYSYARQKFEAQKFEGRPESWSGDSRDEDRMAGYGGEAASSAWTSAEGARRAAASARETAQAARERAADFAGEQFGRARDSLSRLMDEHPLAIGLAGFLAGAAIALTMPSTSVEDSTLGEARDRILDEAKQAGRGALARAQEVAGTAADGAIDAVEKSEADGRRDGARRGT